MLSDSQFAAIPAGHRHLAGGWFVVLGVIIFALVVLQLTAGSILPGEVSASSALESRGAINAPASVSHDADWLIARCGRPDRDGDIGGFEPAPIVPARMLTYGKAHLKIAYVAAVPPGQDPPYHYHWTLMGLIDTRTNHVIDLNAFQSTLRDRLHCVLNH
ncbi:MAG TPA: hypothetical protein VGS02_08155 [Acidobacteriaceae bacterium]|nr:hypothetical protein [Acidobacteriaceae bacterium]